MRLLASLGAVSFVLAAGVILWRPGASESEWIRIQRAYFSAHGSTEAPRVRELSINGSLERCTTCHLDAHPGKWLDSHSAAKFGCVACHGGEGVGLDRDAAHRRLARLARGDIVPEIEARCAACHEGPLRPTVPSPARTAWASFRATVGAPAESSPVDPPRTDDLAPSLTTGRALFRSLRCGACHAATEPVSLATPMRVLGARSSPAQLFIGLRDHAAIAHVEISKDEHDASGAREVALTSIAAHLSDIAQTEAATTLLHRASAPGSSREEGRVLFDRMGCAACHEGDIAGLSARRTADWMAFYLSDPYAANPAATMPNMRVSAREAASLASQLATQAAEAAATMDRGHVPCPLPGEPKPMTKAACGEALVTAMQCASCHSAPPAVVSNAPALLSYGDAHDGPAALAGLEAHGARAKDRAPRFVFTDAERRALATFLVSQRTQATSVISPRGELWESAAGAALYADLGCAGCHESDAPKKALGPSLFGEGLRTRPQWLFGFLRDPLRHPVRPAYHPEWAYRDLVPPERVTSRMPSYRLSEAEATALVHFFAARDGASYPFAATTTPTMTGDTLTSALGDLTHKDRGACVSCHTVGVPEVERARAEGDKLAPPLSLAHTRLRPEWIEACILQPDVWVSGTMPVLVRAPLGPPLPWADSATSGRALDQIDRLRDLLLMLREKTVLPAVGMEGHSPALGLGEP